MGRSNNTAASGSSGAPSQPGGDITGLLVVERLYTQSAECPRKISLTMSVQLQWSSGDGGQSLLRRCRQQRYGLLDISTTYG